MSLEPAFCAACAAMCLALACGRELNPPPAEEPVVGIIERECTAPLPVGPSMCVRRDLGDTITGASHVTFRIVHGVDKAFPPVRGVLEPWHALAWQPQHDPGVAALQVLPPELTFVVPLRYDAQAFIGVGPPPNDDPELLFYAREGDASWTLVGLAASAPSIDVDRPGLWTIARLHPAGAPDAGR